jgi:hypothetical protein
LPTDGAGWHDGRAVKQRDEADARMMNSLVLGLAALLGSATLHAADSCSLPKAKLDEQRLLLLQGNVRQACASALGKHGACSPIPYRAVCRKARCVDAVSAPGAATLATPPLPAAAHHFRYATVGQTCAPWDGPALAIVLSNTAGCAPLTFPHIQISLWRDLPPKAGQTFSFDIRNSNGQASRCLKPNECEAATSGSVVFDIVDEGKEAKGRYELHFKDGGIEGGSFEAEWCENRALCG